MADLDTPMLQVLSTSQYGRGWYAKCSISARTEVIREQPLIHTLCSSQKGLRCDWCLKKPICVKRCTRCWFAGYCGQDCQKSDWDQHRKECRRLASISSPGRVDNSRLIARAMAKLVTKGDSEANECKIIIHRSAEGKMNPIFYTIFQAEIALARTLLKRKYQMSVYNTALKMKNNRFDIEDNTDEDCHAIAAGIFMRSSFFNHSCEPNCVWLIDGREIVIKTIVSIPAGEQLFISYLPDLRDKKQVFELYSFKCTCQRCTKEEGSEKQLAEDIKLHESLYEFQIRYENLQEAIKEASLLVDLYRQHSFYYHPRQVITLYRLGKMKKRAALQKQNKKTRRKMLNDALITLKEAHDALSVALGPKHPFAQDALRLMQLESI